MKGKIFTAQEVQALILGNKRMFREVVKNQPCVELGSGTIECSPISDSFYWKSRTGSSLFNFGKAPYQVGQKIFCKESFAEVEVGAGMGYNSGKQTLYKADDDDYDVKWKPAQHMKQEHSRLTLLIKDIRVERLQDISEEDARKEGYIDDKFVDRASFPPSIKFRDNWNATHKKPEEKWEASPWIWCVSFEVVK